MYIVLLTFPPTEFWTESSRIARAFTNNGEEIDATQKLHCH